MHEILVTAIIDKTMKISLLSNHNITGNELMKIMQVDMDKIIVEPEVKSYIINNLFGIGLNIFILVFLFGWAGFIGVIILIVTLSFRVLFKKAIDKFEEEIGVETGERVRNTMDIFGIIKYIKVTAL